MRTLICAAICVAFSAGASAAPTLIATSDSTGKRTSMQFEFVADSANPTPSVMIELPLDRRAAKGAKIAENCLNAPMGFTALCNIHGTNFKAIIYSGNPDAALPSHVMGTVELPGTLRIAKTGEIEGLSFNVANSASQSVPGEVLSQASGRKPGMEPRERIK